MTLRHARPAWSTPCSPDSSPIRRDAAIGFVPAYVRAPIWSNPAWRAMATSLRLRTLKTVRLRRFALAVVASLIAWAVQAQTPLRVISFDGGWNLPLWAAQRQGFREANGVTVTLSYTPTSAYLVTALLDAKFDIALALMDNVVAYQQGQRDAALAGNPDLFAFLGSDSGFAVLVAAPALNGFADLKGKTVSVDALTTGLAFVLRDLLARNGVAETEV